jgi:hypothetical protein
MKSGVEVSRCRGRFQSQLPPGLSSQYEYSSVAARPATRSSSLEKPLDRARTVVAEPQSLISLLGDEKRGAISGGQAETGSPLCTLNSMAYCKATLHVICGPDAGRRRKHLPRFEQPLVPDHSLLIAFKPMTSR